MGFILGLFVGLVLAVGITIFARIHDAWLLRRFERIVFYGPYKCGGCNQMICATAFEDGRKAYDYPGGLDSIIYPNTEWKRHHCLVY